MIKAITQTLRVDILKKMRWRKQNSRYLFKHVSVNENYSRKMFLPIWNYFEILLGQMDDSLFCCYSHVLHTKFTHLTCNWNTYYITEERIL